MQRFQYTVRPFAAGVTGVVTAVYAACLPEVTVCRRNTISGDWRTWPVVGVAASARRCASVAVFPLFDAYRCGVAQINNGYVAPFLTHFRGMPEFAGTFGASNATLLSSLSQISEALCGFSRWGACLRVPG